MSQEPELQGIEDLVVRTLIAGSPEAVFRLWTEPEHLMRWWGPSGATCPEAHVDLQVGGAYRIANRFPDGQIVWVHGIYEVIEPSVRLEFTWGVGLEEAASERVIVSFKASGNDTEVIIIHQRIPDEASRAGHENGWLGCLAGLQEYARGLSG